MERDKILGRVNKIARNVFENEYIMLSESMTAADVDEWDSLTNLIFINELEDEFSITFTLAEITESKNIGGIVDAIIGHLN